MDVCTCCRVDVHGKENSGLIEKVCRMLYILLLLILRIASQPYMLAKIKV